MATFFQGIILAGTASYLCRNNQATAVHKPLQVWSKVALQANHLFLVLGEIFRQVKYHSPLLVLTAKTVWILTPCVFLFGLLRKTLLFANETRYAQTCSRIYFIAMVISGIALCLLDNMSGISVLGMLALDSTGEPTSPGRIWRYTTGGTALLGGIGFVSWVIAKGTPMDQIALVATAILSLIRVSGKPRTPLPASATHTPPAPHPTSYDAPHPSSTTTYSPPIPPQPYPGPQPKDPPPYSPYPPLPGQPSNSPTSYSPYDTATFLPPGQPFGATFSPVPIYSSTPTFAPPSSSLASPTYFGGGSPPNPFTAFSQQLPVSPHGSTTPWGSSFSPPPGFIP